MSLQIFRRVAKILEKLDKTLAQRYPEVIADAERFTTTLNQMVDRISEVGKAFEAQLMEAKSLEISMRRIPEAAEERLATIIAHTQKRLALRIASRVGAPSPKQSPVSHCHGGVSPYLNSLVAYFKVFDASLAVIPWNGG